MWAVLLSLQSVWGLAVKFMSVATPGACISGISTFSLQNDDGSQLDNYVIRFGSNNKLQIAHINSGTYFQFKTSTSTLGSFQDVTSYTITTQIDDTSSWTLIYEQKGYVRIRNEATKKCLSSGSLDKPINQEDCSSTRNNLLWYLIPGTPACIFNVEYSTFRKDSE